MSCAIRVGVVLLRFDAHMTFILSLSYRFMAALHQVDQDSGSMTEENQEQQKK